MLPIESLQPTTPFRRLMIAQDTGGAILGPARADIYFGAGDEAGSVSGRLRHNGRFVMLVPNGMYVAPPEETPVPRARPPGQTLPDQAKQEPDEPAVAAKAGASGAEAKPAETKPAGVKSAETRKRRSKTAKADAKVEAKKPDKSKNSKTATFDRHGVAAAEIKPPSTKQAEKKSAEKKSEKKSDKKQAHKRKSKSESKS
jgi:membrane-bound lytic murein transglycosylase A